MSNFETRKLALTRIVGMATGHITIDPAFVGEALCDVKVRDGLIKTASDTFCIAVVNECGDGTETPFDILQSASNCRKNMAGFLSQVYFELHYMGKPKAHIKALIGSLALLDGETEIGMAWIKESFDEDNDVSLASMLVTMHEVAGDNVSRIFAESIDEIADLDSCLA